MILTLIQNARLDTAVIPQAEGGEVCLRDESGQTLLRASGRGGASPGSWPWPPCSPPMR